MLARGWSVRAGALTVGAIARDTTVEVEVRTAAQRRRCLLRYQLFPIYHSKGEGRKKKESFL